jgi:hypothetical protein
MTRKLFAFGIILLFAFMLYAQGETAVKINGLLIDNACATAHAKDKDFAGFVKKHKTSCALMPDCAGAGFAVLSDEGKLYKLDEAGNKSAEELLKSTETKMGLAVAVEGTVEGDTVHVTKLTEATKTE